VSDSSPPSIDPNALKAEEAGFTVPLFAEYLTENHPLETFEENA
jgi:hypothetical protein